MDKTLNAPDQLLNEQEALVVRLREVEKLAFPAIGARLGVTRARVGQIYSAATAKLKDVAENGEDALSVIPARVRQALLHCQLASRADARIAIESGQLSWHGGIGSIDWHGQMLPKLSWHTWAALYEWAGRPSLPPQLKLIHGYPANGLSARANNCLSRAHIPATKPAVILALTSGMLSPEKGPGGYGKVTHAELCRWAGVVPTPLKSAQPNRRIKAARGDWSSWTPPSWSPCHPMTASRSFPSF